MITGTVPVKVPEKLSELELDAGGKRIDNLGLGDTPDDVMRRSEKTGDNEVYGLLSAGLAANRPAPGIIDRFYFSTDTLVLERDTGVAWVEAARGETAIRLAQLVERAHGSLTGVTANQHHARDHAARHEPGGADAMTVDAVAGAGSLRTLGAGAQQAMPGNAAPTPGAHAASHQDTGADEISVAGLSGETVELTNHKADLANPHQVTADQVHVEEIDAATHDDLQDWLNNIQSSGRISGGGITDNGNGTVTVATGTGFIKAADSDIGLTKFFDWDEDISVALADNNANYIYLDYNAGAPQILVTTDRASIRTTDQFMIGRVYRSGFNLDILEVGVILFNHTRLEHERLLQVRGFERASGGVISETGQRYLVSTPGLFYLGHDRIITAGKNTVVPPGTDTFTAWYYDGVAGAWVSVAGQAQISNTQYDDITLAGLANLSANRYGVHWIYIGYDGSLHSIYGQGSYKLSVAEAAEVPGSIPIRLSAFAKLAAKVIVKKDAANLTACESAYATLFPVSTPPNHNDLGGIQGGAADEYYHLTEAQHTNKVIKTGALTAGKMVKTNADGVVEDATNTDADVADAVTKRHDRSHDHSNALDGSPIAEAGVPNHMSKNKLAFTLNKILKGAGAGSDPTEVDMPAGDMAKAIYDPDEDGKIALAQLVDAVCSKADADGKIATHKNNASAHHIKYSPPSGLISLWHGIITNIPSGYVICDGNNSTPNLLAKFIEGVATAATNPGTIGGATSKTTAGHTHTNPATGSGGAHTHDVDLWFEHKVDHDGFKALASGTYDGSSGYAAPSESKGAHTHSQGATGSKTDSITDIRPLYYDIAFLMKT